MPVNDKTAKIVTKLTERLQKQSSGVKEYREFYDGEYRLSFSTEGYSREFGEMLKEINDNWLPIVVEAVSERMNVEGFRFGQSEGDNEAWDIWQRNFLDADSELHHTSTLRDGIGYVMVWGETKTDNPIITVEDCQEVYVELVAGSRRQRAYAIKRWVDEWDGQTEYVNLYTPDAIGKFVYRNGQLEILDEATNPMKVVPIVPFFNRPDTKPNSFKSELHDVISTQRQINKILCDAIVASEFAAFRQRWASGVEIEKDKQGKPINPFVSNVNRVWIAEDSGTKFGSFEAADLSNYVTLLENRIQSVASRTRTPPHYLLGSSGTFPSGETLKATETGLIAKTKSRMRHTGEGWEEVMRLAFKAMSDEKRATYYRAETIWADPESRTEAEHVDALVKLRSLNVPLRQLWEDAGYSQEQIDRMTQWATEEALTASLTTPSPIVNVTGTVENASNPGTNTTSNRDDAESSDPNGGADI